MPKVSICLPSLNTRPFLQERFETIFNQTFQDWELIVYDSHSDDGSWEYIQKLAINEPRMRISQGPRNGIYAAFNDCIRMAQGKYIYIATSDDTMAPDCLKCLTEALDANPECGIAHCCLNFIDEKGVNISTGHCWDNWFTTRFFGDWNKKYHVRPCGHDTVVAMSLTSVYYSVTQILTRRSLFDRAGLFENKWGPFGDLEWQMRAALVAKTVHVPRYLATWRVHSMQASQIEPYYRAVREGWFLEMADSVINFSKAQNLPFLGGLPRRLRYFYWRECIKGRLDVEKKRLRKILILMTALYREPGLVARSLQNWCLKNIFKKHTGNARENQVRKDLDDLGLNVLSLANHAS
jgi:glycosyltransferase involved in cell wall biosynthesis